ncbi:MAG: hypothetical protein WBL87_05850, partial [Methanothrix sp.]
MLDLPTYLKPKKIKRRVPKLDTVEKNLLSILKILIFLTAISFLVSIVFWIFEGEGISVKPFETVGIGESSDGKSLGILLSFDLQRIKNIYSEPDILEISKNTSRNKTIPRPLWEFSIPSFYNFECIPFEYSISQMGALSVGGASIPISNIALYIKEFIGNKANTLTCSLQRYNSTVNAVAILEYQKETITFQAASNISNDEQILDVINNLAFQISLELGKRGMQPEEYDILPRNWQTFKYMTQGRDAYNNYLITKNVDNLKIGTDMALLARNFEPDYE